MEKSFDLDIDLNAKTEDEYTAFHMARDNGHLEIVQMLTQKLKEFNIDVDAKHIGSLAEDERFFFKFYPLRNVNNVFGEHTLI